jgi:hypothetical protein
VELEQLPGKVGERRPLDLVADVGNAGDDPAIERRDFGRAGAHLVLDVDHVLADLVRHAVQVVQLVQDLGPHVLEIRGLDIRGRRRGSSIRARVRGWDSRAVEIRLAESRRGRKGGPRIRPSPSTTTPPPRVSRKMTSAPSSTVA